MDGLFGIEGEEKLFPRKEKFNNGVGPLLKDRLVVGHQREHQGIERGHVLDRAGHVGGVRAALEFIHEPAVVTEPIIDHSVDGLIEGADRIAAMVAEPIEPARNVLEGGRCVTADRIQPEPKLDGLARSPFRTESAQDGREHHGLGGAIAVAQGNTEAAVFQQRQWIEGELAGVDHHRDEIIALAHKRGGHRALKTRSEVRLCGEPALLPDERLPELACVRDRHPGRPRIGDGKPGRYLRGEPERQQRFRGPLIGRSDRRAELEAGVVGKRADKCGTRLRPAGRAQVHPRGGGEHVGRARGRVSLQNPIIEAITGLRGRPLSAGQGR